MSLNFLSQISWQLHSVTILLYRLLTVKYRFMNTNYDMVAVLSFSDNIFRND